MPRDTIDGVDVQESIEPPQTSKSSKLKTSHDKPDRDESYYTTPELQREPAPPANDDDNDFFRAIKAYRSPAS